MLKQYKAIRIMIASIWKISDTQSATKSKLNLQNSHIANITFNPLAAQSTQLITTDLLEIRNACIWYRQGLQGIQMNLNKIDLTQGPSTKIYTFLFSAYISRYSPALKIYGL